MFIFTFILSSCPTISLCILMSVPKLFTKLLVYSTRNSCMNLKDTVTFSQNTAIKPGARCQIVSEDHHYVDIAFFIAVKSSNTERKIRFKGMCDRGDVLCLVQHWNVYFVTQSKLIFYILTDRSIQQNSDSGHGSADMSFFNFCEMKELKIPLPTLFDWQIICGTCSVETEMSCLHQRRGQYLSTPILFCHNYLAAFSHSHKHRVFAFLFSLFNHFFLFYMTWQEEDILLKGGTHRDRGV